MNEKLRNEIASLRAKGVSIRAMARELGIARNTVKSVLLAIERERSEGAEHPDLTAPVRRASCLDAHEGTIRKLLSAHKDITAQRVLEGIAADVPAAVQAAAAETEAAYQA